MCSSSLIFKKIQVIPYLENEIDKIQFVIEDQRYQFSLMPNTGDFSIKEGQILIKKEGNDVTYQVITPKGDINIIVIECKKLASKLIDEAIRLNHPLNFLKVEEKFRLQSEHHHEAKESKQASHAETEKLKEVMIEEIDILWNDVLVEKKKPLAYLDKLMVPFLHLNFKKGLTRSPEANHYLTDKVRNFLLARGVEEKSVEGYLLKEYRKYPLERMKKCFSEINRIQSQVNDLTEEDKVALEKYKLMIMKSLENHLKMRFLPEDSKEIVQRQERISVWQVLSMLFIVFFDVIAGSVGGFLGIQNFFMDFISFGIISPWVRYGIGIALCGFDCILGYSIMQPFTMKAVGISQEDNKNSLANFHKEQLRVVKSINHILRSDTCCYCNMRSTEYSRYITLATKFNEYLSGIEFKEFEEKPLKRWLRYLLLTSFSIIAAANGYFVFKSFIVLVAGGIAGTTVAHIIIATLLIGQLVARLVIRLQSIHEMLYPSEKEQKEVKKNLKRLKDPTIDFNNILTNKKERESKIKSDYRSLPLLQSKDSPDFKQKGYKAGEKSRPFF